jgi:tetratricopeptide (TPR) repeat protein
MNARVLIGALACLAAGNAFADEGQHHFAACPGSTSAQVVEARAKAKAAPKSLEALFGLADALVAANCLDEAVHRLDDGRMQHPRSPELQAKLRNTRSLVSEQVYFEGKDQAEQAARLSRNVLRCTRLGDLAACDEALKEKPDDVEVLLAKGDALMKASRFADAESTYRRVKQQAPGSTRAAAQLSAAVAQRQEAVSRCLRSTGEPALASCQSALAPGVTDEFALQSRLGFLYQQRNQPVLALSAYMAAQALQPGDRAVASGIVALTEGASKDDAIGQSARKTALKLLGGNVDAAPRAAAATVAPAAASPVITARVFTNASEPTRSH